MEKRATIRDVAKQSGVSVATVSRVLAGSDYPVSERTRERVLAASRELGYLPNATGKMLKTQVTRELGVIVPNITNPCYSLLMQGVHDAANRAGYRVLLCNSHSDAKQEAVNLMTLLENRVDGMLLASINPDWEAVRRVLGVGVPLVTLEQKIPVDCPHVGFDYRGGSFMATSALIECGHRALGFVGAPLDRYSRRMYLQGFLDAMEAHGLSVNGAFVMLDGVDVSGAGVYEIENGARCAKRYLAMRERPTGYVCVNDMTAFGAMRAFRDGGLRVPEDVSVVGFDNVPFCELSVPTLTTIDRRAYEMGVRGVARLLAEIAGEGGDSNETLDPRLVKRASVCAPRSETRQGEVL